MKAIRVHSLGAPEVMQLEEIHDPQPIAGQIVVQVKAVGVNPVDTYIRAGMFGSPNLPYTPGMDAAGIVESVGEGVTKVAVGDRVYTAGTISGAYAQKTLCLESQVHCLPEQVSFTQGGGVYVPYATAYYALYYQAQVLPGEWLLIHGASGGVGIASLQWARAAGIKIIGSAGTERGRQLVKEQGAHYVVNHDDPQHFEEILQVTGGVNVILEMLANANLGQNLQILAPQGRVVVIGSRGTVEINPFDTMLRSTRILGMSLLNASAIENYRINAAIVAGLTNGTLSPVIGKQLTLNQAPQAHHDILEQKAYGKIILLT